MNIVVAKFATTKNCFTCARSSYYMCHKPGMFDDPWEVACCTPNSKEANCNRKADGVTCSPTFREAGFAFYTYCPNIKPQSCGIKEGESGSKMALETSNDKITYTFR